MTAMGPPAGGAEARAARTLGIVEGLEAIDVDHRQRQRQRQCGTAATAPFDRQHLVELPPLGDAGQAIDKGHRAHAVFLTLARQVGAHTRPQHGRIDRPAAAVSSADVNRASRLSATIALPSPQGSPCRHFNTGFASARQRRTRPWSAHR
jgi:hypothetical protein